MVSITGGNFAIQIMIFVNKVRKTIQLVIWLFKQSVKHRANLFLIELNMDFSLIEKNYQLLTCKSKELIQDKFFTGRSKPTMKCLIMIDDYLFERCFHFLRPPNWSKI